MVFHLLYLVPCKKINVFALDEINIVPGYDCFLTGGGHVVMGRTLQ